MRHRSALLGPLALLALQALRALLLAGGVSVVAACPVNKIEEWVWFDFLYKWGNDKRCVECGVGKYGHEGKCYDCPFFTRQRKYRDVAGTLWCSNSCEQMWENRAAVHDVEFRGIKTISEAKQTVLQYEVLELAFSTASETQTHEPPETPSAKSAQAKPSRSRFEA
jgi:hypothetical protein